MTVATISTPELADRLGCSYIQLDHWLRRYRGHVGPSMAATGSGSRRQFNPMAQLQCALVHTVDPATNHTSGKLNPRATALAAALRAWRLHVPAWVVATVDNARAAASPADAVRLATQGGVATILDVAAIASRHGLEWPLKHRASMCHLCSRLRSNTADYGDPLGITPPGNPRLPWEPIERILTVRAGQKLSIPKLARALDVDPNQIMRWRALGVRFHRADALAVRLGKHPTDLWGPDYEAVEFATCPAVAS